MNASTLAVVALVVALAHFFTRWIPNRQPGAPTPSGDGGALDAAEQKVSG